MLRALHHSLFTAGSSLNLIYALHKTKKLDSRSRVVIAALVLPVFRKQLSREDSQKKINDGVRQ
jgi:hypothetical protein